MPCRLVVLGLLLLSGPKVSKCSSRSSIELLVRIPVSCLAMAGVLNSRPQSFQNCWTECPPLLGLDTSLEHSRGLPTACALA